MFLTPTGIENSAGQNVDLKVVPFNRMFVTSGVVIARGHCRTNKEACYNFIIQYHSLTKLVINLPSALTESVHVPKRKWYKPHCYSNTCSATSSLNSRFSLLTLWRCCMGGANDVL